MRVQELTRRFRQLGNCSPAYHLKNQKDNMPMQYTAIFTDVKKDNFQQKNDVFLIFVQTINCGYA